MIKPPVKNLINGIGSDYLNINDRAIHYGDGLFETILCSHNTIYFWPQHYQRLQTSAEKLKLNCPDEKTLLSDITQLLEQNNKSTRELNKQNYAVKIILTRGVSGRGYQYTANRLTKKCNANRLVLLSAIESDYSSLLCRQLLSGDLFLCKQQASINESLAGMKHLNRLENVLARNEWNSPTTENKFIDGLMLNSNQHVIEGTMSNLFAVKDNRLYTPDLSQSGVSGVMRGVIIALAKQNNMRLSIVNLSIDEIFSMDELFISNSLIAIKSVTKLGDSLYKNSITNTLFNQLLKKIKEQHG